MNNLANSFKPLVMLLRKYGLVLFIMIVGAVYSFIIYTSSNLVTIEPAESEVQNNYKAARRPKLEPGIADKISELEDRNVGFQALIDQARKNPFAE